MAYAGRAGHNENTRGAVGILDEVIEDRKIFNVTKKYLSMIASFTDCTPYHNPSTVSEDLNYGISKANSSGASLFYSIHLNKFLNSGIYQGYKGCEVWVYDRNSTKAIEAARGILANLEALEFYNRGIKYMKESGRELGELMYTKMNAIIVECFFLEATEDVALYQKLGADTIGLAIARGIDPRITNNQEKKCFIVTNYIPQGKYGIEINEFNKIYFNDVSRIYLKNNEKGIWVETQYLAKEKCEELKGRLGDLFWEIKQE